MAGSLLFGSKDAEVGAILFTDFECPFCARLADTVIPEFRRDYVDTGRVLLAIRHYPLDKHSNARGAAVLAECFGRQGHFWPIHDVLFQAKGVVPETSLASLAESLGVDPRALSGCRANKAIADLITEHKKTADGLSVSGTPTMFIGRLSAASAISVSDVIVGAQPASTFASAVERLK
jgi:protein-disulfide isomerase